MSNRTARTVSGDVPLITEALRSLWSQGQRPDVRTVVSAQTEASPDDVLEAVIFDQRARWQIGERIPAEAYLQWFPALRDDGELTLDLIYHEFLLREELGDEPTADEYALRFPEQAESLKLQIDLHRAIDGHVLDNQNEPLDDTAPLVRRRNRSTRSSWPDIPGYEVLEEIGRGGMGVIYKARQKSGERVVALKMISSGEFAVEAELARFRIETEAIVHLQHPHIVRMYEAGTHKGLPWFALEYMDRGSLAGRIAGQPLPPRHAAKLVEILARAMQAAHERGVIHRDLKPANVLLATPAETSGKGPAGDETAGLLGIPKISDFGLAKRLDGDGGQTTSGAILGTPYYMAPEQAEGKTKHVGPAADIYSLGAILYEALTGRPPHKGATLLETLEMVRTEEPIAPDKLRPDLPGQLVAICLNAIAKEPHRRYATAAAMADDLQLFLGDRRVKARRETMLGRGWRWCLRNPRVAAPSAGVAVLLLVALGVLGIAAVIRDERDKAVEAQRLAEEADRTARAALGQLKRAQAEIEMRSHLAKAGFYRRSGHIGQRFKALAELKAAVALGPSEQLKAELRNEALAALVLPDLEVVRVWQSNPEAADAVYNSYSSDWKKFARTLRTGEIHVGCVTEAGVEEVLWRLPDSPEPPYGYCHFSPNGRALLVSRQAPGGRGIGIRLWRWDDAKEPKSCLAPEDEQTRAHESAVSFSADSKRLAIGQADGVVRIFDVETGKRVKTLRLETRPFQLNYHPKDYRLAAADHKKVLILDPEGSRPPLALNQPGGTWLFDWHPDGKRLAVGSPDYKIHIWDIGAAKEVKTLSGHHQSAIYCRFNQAGDWLLSADYSGQVRVWDMVSGRNVFTATDLPVAWGPGELLGPRIQEGQARLWRLAPGREIRLLRRRGAHEDEFISSPGGLVDSRVLPASCTHGGSEWRCFFDLERGEELLSVPDRGLVNQDVRDNEGAAWLTGTPLGAMLWPFRLDPERPGVLRIGPPQRLANQPRSNSVLWANDKATVLAFPQFDQAFVLNRTDPEKSFPIEGLHDVRTCAVSPDGRWAVMCSWWPDQTNSTARIWDVQTGKHVHDLPLYELAQAAFSPDGRWLVDFDHAVSHVREVGTWREAWKYIGTAPAFSPDSKMIAVGGEPGIIRLFALDNGKELGRLTAPTAETLAPAAFTRDGARLITTTRDNKQLWVWDLRRLRAGLKELGLDWRWTEIPPAPDLPPLQSAEIDLGFLRDHGRLMDGTQRLKQGNRLFLKNPFDADAYWFRGMGNHLLQKHELAVADLSLFLMMTPAKDPRRAEAFLRRAMLSDALKQPAAALDDALQLLKADPRHIPEAEWAAKECNNLAWPYVFAGKKKEDVGKAVAVARAAVDLEPWDADHRNTLGMVLYRDGQFREAIDVMEKNLPRDHLYAGYDFYFLAMSCQKTGEPAKAKQYFDRALQWEQQRKNLSNKMRSTLKSFQAEARATLQLQ